MIQPLISYRQKGLFRKAKERDSSIRLKDVEEWYKDKLDIQRHVSQKDTYDNFRITSHDPNSSQMDLAFWHKIPILAAININSRLGFAKILKNKGAIAVLGGIKQFVKEERVHVLTSDNGKEFLNRKLQAFLKERKITHYNNDAGDHAKMGKIERFNRTLKMRLPKLNQPITEKLLSDVVSGYNNTWHSSIKMTPNQARGSTIEKDLDHNRELIEKVEGNLPIKSTVLYRLSKGVFDKENARWSNTIYEIVGIDGYRVQIRSKNGHTLYKSPNDIKLFNSKPTDAPFENGQIYEAERLLKHKKMSSGKLKYLVKWKGYDEPTWESQDNLRLINKNRRSKLEQTCFTR